MNDQSLETVRQRVLALRRAGWKALAERSGVPFSTIRKFAYGEVQEPGYNTVRAMLENLDDCHGARVSAEEGAA